jgi:DNA-binding transcriptional LysR family regulator
MNIELRHLRYFLAVAESGHMTRAAEHLGIQQPPLSMQIRALEKHLGMALFHRRPRGMDLTDSGKAFVVEAQHIVSEFAAMEKRMLGMARGEQGTLKIGFTSSVATHAFIPDALRSMRKLYPDIILEITEDNAAALTEAVANAQLHCALLRVPVSRPENLVFETLLHEPVMVALPLDHSLAKKNTDSKPMLSLSELRQESFILVRRPGAPGLYANFVALCEAQGFQPRVVAEVPRMMTNLNLVAAGVGISIVPASMQDVQRNAISYLPLKGSTRLDAPITLVWREEDLMGSVKTFVDLLRKTAAQHSS